MQKNPDNPQVSTVETDETGFGGFVTTPLGIFPEFSAPTLRLFTSISQLPGYHPGGTTMYKYLSCFILLMAAIASAQNPIPRQGDSCPTGTYKSGDYCKPFKSNSDQVIIQKSGKGCPTGFYKSGNYCKRISSSDREAIPREKGASCPTGWRKSKGYCVKQ
jgi:hypothetical protein